MCNGAGNGGGSGAGKGRHKAVSEVIRQERRGKLPLWERGADGGRYLLTAVGEAVKEGGEALKAVRASNPECSGFAAADDGEEDEGVDDVEGEGGDRLVSEDEAEAEEAEAEEAAALRKGTIVQVPATEFSLPHGSFVRVACAALEFATASHSHPSSHASPSL